MFYPCVVSFKCRFTFPVAELRWYC